MLAIEYDSTAQNLLGIDFTVDHICDCLLTHPYVEVITTLREMVHVASNTCHVCKILLSILDRYAGGRAWVHTRLTIKRGYPYDRFIMSGEKDGVMQQSFPFYIFTPSGITQRRIPLWLSAHAYVSDIRL